MAILEKPMVTVKRFFTFVTEFVRIREFTGEKYG